MMFGYGNGWPVWEGTLMWIGMLAFLGVLIWAGYALITGATRKPGGLDHDGTRAGSWTSGSPAVRSTRRNTSGSAT